MTQPQGNDSTVDAVPDPWLVQCHHYMLCTGYRQADIAALIGGQSCPFGKAA